MLSSKGDELKERGTKEFKEAGKNSLTKRMKNKQNTNFHSAGIYELQTFKYVCSQNVKVKDHCRNSVCMCVHECVCAR